MPPFSPSPAGATVHVRVTPRAGRSAIAGVRDDVLLVRLAAAPVDGAANDALIALLSNAFDLPKGAIRLVSGERSRTKRVELAGATPDALDRRLAGILGG